MKTRIGVTWFGIGKDVKNEKWSHLKRFDQNVEKWSALTFSTAGNFLARWIIAVFEKDLYDAVQLPVLYSVQDQGIFSSIQ